VSPGFCTEKKSRDPWISKQLSVIWTCPHVRQVQHQKSNTKKWKSPFTERSCAPVVADKECHRSTLRRSVQNRSKVNFQIVRVSFVNSARQGMMKHLSYIGLSTALCEQNIHSTSVWMVMRMSQTIMSSAKGQFGRTHLRWRRRKCDLLQNLLTREGFSGKNRREHHQRPHENVLKNRRETKKSTCCVVTCKAGCATYRNKIPTYVSRKMKDRPPVVWHGRTLKSCTACCGELCSSAAVM